MKEPVRVVWPDRCEVGLEEFQLREPDEGEVVIETEYSLISPGTELAFLKALPNTSQRFPQYPGYNNIGRVVKLGRGVELSEGDRVVSPAGHASMVKVPATEALEVPSELSSEEAVYFNMAAIALQGVRKAQVELGEAVLVMGQGLIGNLALQLARLSGGFPVIGADLVDKRLEISRECGADLAVNPQYEDLKSRLREVIGRESVDLVVDATGVPEVVGDCLGLIGYRGRVVLLASTRGETQGVNFYRDVHRKGVTIIGAHNSVRPKGESTRAYWTASDDWDVVLKLMAADRLKVEPLTTDVLGFREAPRAYDRLDCALEKHLGVLLDWM
ncbi:MAG: zinc-binding alcohol dehydrogenase [Chloroflexota bacterium]|nr:zinc-binding alcohol dehydrogenase [Chloroflexota bacterium]